jgi:hypothetical protein
MARLKPPDGRLGISLPELLTLFDVRLRLTPGKPGDRQRLGRTRLGRRRCRAGLPPAREVRRSTSLGRCPVLTLPSSSDTTLSTVAAGSSDLADSRSSRPPPPGPTNLEISARRLRSRQEGWEQVLL